MAMQRDRLALLVRLAAYTPEALEAMRPGDRLNLADELHAYIGGFPTPEVKAARRGKVMELWPALEVVGGMVKAVAHRKDTRRVPVEIKALTLDARALRHRKEPGAAVPAWSFMVDGLRDTLICQAWFDLTSSPETYRIDVCALPTCAAIFFADRKDQRFCSHACASKKALRDFKAGKSKKRQPVAQDPPAPAA